MSILKMKQQQHDINFWGGLGKKYIYKKKNPSPRWDLFVGGIFDML